jgi:hypothetical protein
VWVDLGVAVGLRWVFIPWVTGGAVGLRWVLGFGVAVGLGLPWL